MNAQTEQVASKLLESLTPGGSEFHNDPQRCYEFAKIQGRLAVKYKMQRDRAVEALHAIRAFAIQLPPDDVDIAGRNDWRMGALNDIANMATTALAAIDQEPTDA